MDKVMSVRGLNIATGYQTVQLRQSPAVEAMSTPAVFKKRVRLACQGLCQKDAGILGSKGGMKIASRRRESDGARVYEA